MSENNINKSNKPKIYLLTVCILLLVALGAGIVLRDDYARDAKQISDIVEEDLSSRESSSVNTDTKPHAGIIVPTELLKSMDKYQDEFSTPYTYKDWEKQAISDSNDKEIHRIINDANPNWEALSWYASLEECEYLAYPAEKVTATEPTSYGYEKIGTTENYDIYHHPGKDYDGSWLITQYGDPNGNQLMFYTLQSREGDLIVVDGGWNTNAPSVRQTLADLGNHVDAWILTHPHADHVGVFCEIYPAPGELQIDTVYTVDMASPELCLENASWDDVSAYEQFLSLDIAQLTYVYTGDVFEIEGLDFHILSAYEDYVDQISKDLLNDGSMMFKITAEEESMLFCADVGIDMTDYILNSAGDHLKADYLQIGHHGNGGLADYFYRHVDPEITLFDAPNWLMEDPEDRFTTPENKQLMLDIGSEVYSFTTAPNQFVLE